MDSDLFNSRFQYPVPYIFNKSNDEVLENIISIFIYLKNYSSFVDICLNQKFMDYIYQKKWHEIYNHLFYLMFSKYNNTFNLFKPYIELSGIKFIKLSEMCEYIVENIYD